jgi:hypothetical protein
MKIKILPVLLYVIFFNVSCQDAIMSNDKMVLNIGGINSNQTIINVDLVSNLTDIESILFNDDTCCSFSEKFSLMLNTDNREMKINTRVYRDCADHLIAVGEQRYQGVQVVKVRNNEMLYVGKVYDAKNINKIFDIFFEQKKFDDNLCVIFLDKKSKSNNIKEFTSFLLEGYLKFISKNEINDIAKYNFELIFMLDSYVLEYDKSPFLLHNEERRLGNVPNGTW